MSPLNIGVENGKHYNNARQIFKSSFIKGFTIAEVLITLGIIGVVVALTLPSIVANYQKKVAVAKLKKVYSSVAQILEKEQVVESLDEWDNSEKILKKYFVPNFQGAKVYSASSNNGYRVMCRTSWYKYFWATGVGISTPFKPDTAAIELSDGTCIGINPNPTRDVFIDINGSYNPPNKAGKDLFFFIVNSDGRLLPYGHDWRYEQVNRGRVGSCNKQDSGGGHVCAAKIMMDNWEMKKDYPW